MKFRLNRIPLRVPAPAVVEVRYATEIPVNMDELRELIELIREHEFTEFELEREGFRVRFRRGAEACGTAQAGTAQAQTSASTAQSTSAATASETGSRLHSAPSHPGSQSTDGSFRRSGSSHHSLADSGNVLSLAVAKR